MTLLEQWRESAYASEMDEATGTKFWQDYFLQEQAVYKKLLATPDEAVSGTVEELAKKYNMELLTFVGFLDGINDSLKKPNDIEKMKETTKISLDFDQELLYKNMVEAKADWLYTLEEWDAIFTKDKQDELYKAQKKSHTFVADKKVGRNDPCPCGSGKKYKKCCGK